MNAVRRCALVVVALLLGACTTATTVKVTSSVPEEVLVDSMPLHVAVRFEPAFSEYVYREDYGDRKGWQIALGDAQVAAMSNVFEEMFDQVTFLDANGVVPVDVDALLVPRVDEVQFATPGETAFEFYEAWLQYGLELRSSGDEPIADWLITAYGKTPDSRLLMEPMGLDRAAQVALRDVGARLSVGFRTAPGIEEWLDVKLDR